MEDLSYLDKLKYEQKKVLQENEKSRAKKTEIRDEYIKLKEKLQTFSDEITRPTMVPIGEIAFFPGHFIHTNEITVLLGENWFVERSSKQALEITERRIKMVDAQLSELMKEFDNMKAHMEYTNHFQAIQDEHNDIQEIKEEIDDFTGAQKIKRRKAHVPKHDLIQRSVQPKVENTKTIDKNSEEFSSNKDSTINHNELLARLNELEKEEEEEEEKEHSKIMNEILAGTYKPDESEGNTSGNNASVVRKGGEHKHVQFDSDVDDARNSDGEHEGIENVIKFQHSSDVQRERSASESDVTRKNVNSPADIYEQYRRSDKTHDTDERPLKSILKKDSRSNSNENLRLRPILKTSPEHRPGTPEYTLDDQPKPILKTPPDTQGSERRPGTPEYGLSDEPRPILKSHYDTTDCKSKSEVHFSESNSYVADYYNDETRSILKSGDIDRYQSNNDDEQKKVLKHEQPKTILKSPEAVRANKVLESCAEPRPILKHHSSEAFFGEIVERDGASIMSQFHRVTTSQKPVSRFKASRLER
ncbi:RNA polymerase II subunit 5-mediating protein homolog [Hydractinia symbiolongicarpus]|uniref:RNA polymerase II subunit 5-mediating protein homolog n=1 Tax=Hydractinia symbiolongicarpus TaxID=13093 RepID=UPI00254CFF12|nr:RNA polymerase II subunit 5-mediating protein homolog [Hydractinia symbiolongicarpus]